MRISRRIQLAGLVVLAGAGAATEAAADDLTISNATTNPVFTATAAGAPPSPGDVLVQSGGSITLDGVGETAITVNSSNDVTNNGTLTATNVNNTGGIRIQDGFAGTILNSGQINFTDGYTLTDTDSDGDLDGEWATGTGRFGILLEPGTFTGNISSTGSITIEGNDSYGIVLNGLLDGNGTTTGNLTTTGAINVIGDDSVAVAILGGAAGGVAGDVHISSNITASGEGTRGLVVDAAVGGEVRLAGTWNVTGFHSQFRPLTNTLDLGDDDLIGGAAASIHQSVANGVIVQGVGQTDDDDDDEDGENDEADDNRNGALNTFGSAPALWIANQGGSSLDIGPASNGFGVNNYGLIYGRGVQDNIDAVGVRIESLSGSAVTTADGFHNEGAVRAQAFEANATALHIGADASVPTIQNLGIIQAEGVSEGADTTAAILIDEFATQVGALTNSGSVIATLTGEDGDAIAVRDLSGTLTAIDNTGVIGAAIVPTDDDPSDGIPPVITGSAIAIDVTNASAGVSISQTENADEDINERIQGDILLGAFADTIDLQAGEITGNISFGAGVDQFAIGGGALYRGALDDSGGDLDIDVQDGTLHLTGGNAQITSANFGAESAFTVQLADSSADPLIEATGSVTFAAGATVTPLVPTGLVDGSYVFLTAGSLTGGANVTGVVDGEGIPFIYNFEIALTDPLAVDGAANGLEAIYDIKTAAELGMTQNQGAAFNPIIAALQLDDNASAAIIGIDNEGDFFDAYEDLMPSYAAASAELAATAIQQSQSATSNRLAATRLQGLDEVSAWVQEIGYGLTREPPTANGQAFEGHGFGLAMGIDGPLDNGAMFGLSASFIASEAEEEGRPDGEISASLGQLNAYFGTAMGPLDIDLIGGIGAGQLQSRRFVQIGDAFSAQTEAEWWAYEGHGAARVSAPMSAGWLVITPQAALTYVYMSEEGYSEEGGGEAIDYEVGDASSQRLWGDVGVEFSGRFQMGRGGIIAPRIFAGYRANLIDEEAERTFKFVSGGDEFTLTDEGFGDGAPIVGIGVDGTNGFSTVSLGYEGEFGDQIERHSLNVGVRFRF